MAEIRPFQGIYYNPSVVKDLATVICPPYDVIPPQMQDELYHRSEYNFIRLEFGREQPQDKDTDSRYTRAAATLQKWLEQNVLQADSSPAIYLHDHYFTHHGRKYQRRGIICLARLEEWDKMTVRPHEGTLAKPKSDRLSLLWALQANTSPILALYDDRGKKVASLLEKQSQGQPMQDIDSGSGEVHRLWAINDPDVVSQICDHLARNPFYIADGHHRYESALAYQRERRTCSPPASGDEPFDFVMMTLIDFSDPGLVILPAHRLIRGLSKPASDGLIENLKTLFEIEEVPLDANNTGNQVNDLLTREADEVKLVLYGPSRERLYVLRLRDFETANRMMPYFHSDLYKRLDVSILDHVVLEEMLGLSHDTTGDCIAYSHDIPDVINRVADEEYQAVFMINPVKPEAVKAIADNGDRMPRKSTYFYPKSPAGLVFYRFG